MHTAASLTDTEFVAAFADGSLPPACFDHRGHLRLAWLCLNTGPEEAAVERVCAGIARLAARLGVPGKYHRTLTEALVRLIAARVRRAPGTDFAAFLAANPDLVADAKAVLARHYSAARLDSAEARSRFLPPDLQALD